MDGRTLPVLESILSVKQFVELLQIQRKAGKSLLISHGMLPKMTVLFKN